jgi:hypothetical protein
MQSGKLIARSLRQHFDAAVVIIADPAGDPEQMGLALHEPAEPYALHSTSYDEAAGFDGFFCHHVFVPGAGKPNRRILVIFFFC